jgi:CubicO group peptidase (beta-lactamase class C family)
MNRLRTLAVALSLISLAGCATQSAHVDAAPKAQTAGQRSAFSPERLKRIDELLQRYADEEQIAGVVALVLEHGRPVYEGAVGWRDREAGVKMTSDTLFRIASQTKAITSVAALMLMEEGKLALSTPVSRFIPAYAKTTVAVEGQSGVEIQPAKREITIRDLLTHTAGVSYGREAHLAALYEAKGLGPAAGNGWYLADKDEAACTTMERLASVPFVAQPGEKYVYGYATDILGCVVERASGMPLDQFFRTRITEPLGMRDTRFYVEPADRGRLAVLYGSGSDGKAVRAIEGSRGQGHYVDGPRRSYSGGAGLLSTARDYARFLEMIRNDGELDGVRLLAPRTVQLMRTNQIADLYPQPGMGWGLAFQTVERYGANGMDAVGAFGWAGAYGTTYRIDPEAGLTIVFMLQLMPYQTDVREHFANLVYAALIGP